MRTILIVVAAMLAACGGNTPTPTNVTVGTSDAGIVTCITIVPILGPDGAVVGKTVTTVNP